MTLVRDNPARSRFAPARAAWRSLMVHVQPEQAALPRLRTAADLARSLDARLLGIGAEMLQPMGFYDPAGVLGGQFAPALLELVQDNLKKAGEAFAKETGDLQAEWMTLEAFPAHVLARLAREADLVVAGGSPLAAHDSYRWADPAELALECGRPVLVVPPKGGTLQARKVVVAWKDTREARRALADSLPILKCADEVLVLAVCGADERADARPHTASVAAYLVRHGVEARDKVVTAPSSEVAGLLQAEAASLGADLIVSGAYGHSRLGEWVFGGVTIDLLHDPQRFLLISH
jgi:nucleotide-binding universal stress UspA family protein